MWRYFLEKLRATPDGDGNLLDHSLILYGSGMSNSNIHNHAPLPVLVAGGAAGKMKGGRHLKYPEGHADGESAAHYPGQSRRAAGERRRQHRDADRAVIGGSSMKTLFGMLLMTLVAQAGFAAGTEVADAVQNRDVATLRSLVKQHATVNAAQPDGTTALHWAAHWNDLEAVNSAAAARAPMPRSPIATAPPRSRKPRGGQRAQSSKQLLKAGADPNTRNTADGETVLMTAARAGNVDAVKACSITAPT